MTPTLGYPSRGEAVKALTEQGLDRHEIAARIGILPKTVSVHQFHARCGRPTQRLQNCPRMRLSQAVVDALDAHALKRGMTANALARLILRTVVEGKLVDAVLDDGDGK